jgi:cytochrome b
MPQLVWDLPVRLCHWVLTLSIFSAYLLPQFGRPGSVPFGWHVIFGIVAGLTLVWRLAWGFVGSKHARFGALRFRPAAVAGYFRLALKGESTPYTGHNPGSAVAIWVMFGLIALTVVSGLFADSGVRVWRQVHEAVPNVLMAVVAVHVIGTILATLRNRENYVAAMFSGFKKGEPADAIAHTHRVAAAIMTVWVALGAAYFTSGFQFSTGTFTPPGTSVSIRLAGPRRPRPRIPGQQPPAPPVGEAQRSM